MDKQEFSHLRKKLNKTQKQMAQLLGVSIKAVHSYEQGWRMVRRLNARCSFWFPEAAPMVARNATAGKPATVPTKSRRAARHGSSTPETCVGSSTARFVMDRRTKTGKIKWRCAANATFLKRQSKSNPGFRSVAAGANVPAVPHNTLHAFLRCPQETPSTLTLPPQAASAVIAARRSFICYE